MFPKGGIWYPILFNFYTRLLDNQVLYSDLFQYPDDESLWRWFEQRRNGLKLLGRWINADLNSAYLWGRPWNINFEAIKCFSLCVSLERDTDHHPPWYMASLLIEEIESLKILGFHFWQKVYLKHNDFSIVYSYLLAYCMGALYPVRECLGPMGLLL